MKILIKSVLYSFIIMNMVVAYHRVQHIVLTLPPYLLEPGNTDACTRGDIVFPLDIIQEEIPDKNQHILLPEAPDYSIQFDKISEELKDASKKKLITPRAELPLNSSQEKKHQGKVCFFNGQVPPLLWGRPNSGLL